MKKLRRIIASLLPVLLLLTFLTGNANALLNAAGPLNVPSPPADGFPAWYQDAKPLALEGCLSQTVLPLVVGGGPACVLLADPGFIPTNPVVFPTNYPVETFYFVADAVDPGGIAGFRFRWRGALEGSFATGAVTPGGQVVFSRIRITADVPVAGTYTVTHPYGVEVLNAPVAGARAITFTRDIGLGAFPAGALTGDIGPFLTQVGFPQTVAGATGPETYIGNPNILLRVTGSPTGNNFVRIVGPAGSGIGGPGVDTLTINVFTVAGKVFVGQVPSPLTIDRSTYARDAAGAAQIDIFATALPTAILNIGGTGLAASSLTQDVPNTGKFFAYLTAAALPTGVSITNSLDVPPIIHTVTLVDEVNISQAFYNPVTRNLTVKADSRDNLAPLPTLTVTAFGAPHNLDATGTAVIPAPLNTIPPMTVQVASSKGGSATSSVSIVTPPAAPVAVNDTATTTAGIPVTVSVLANDTTTVTLDPASVALVATPLAAQGTATVNFITGTITFIPAAGFSGTATFTYDMKDNFGQLSNTATVTVTVNPAPLVITNAATLTPYTLGSGAYPNTTLAATGGIAPYTWSVAPLSTLPAGLVLTAGVLSGTPTTAGTFNFSLRVTDSQVPAVTTVKAFTLVVSPAALAITTTTPLTPYTLGSGAYVAPALTATGGTAPYTWTVAPLSTLPTGLTLAAGALSGTPTTAGTFNFSLQVTDSQVPAVTAVKPFTLVVSPAGPAPLVISNPALADGIAGTPYVQTLAATGGTAPYTWAVAPLSTLPAGLSVTGNALSGTPTTAGTFTFSLQVTDSQVPAVTTVKAFAIVVTPAGPAPLVITNVTLANGTAGTAYVQTLAATGGTAPYTWAVAPLSTLPAGLSVTGNALSGTPTTAGTFTFSLQVTDSQVPAATTVKAFTLVVSPAAPSFTGLSIVLNGGAASTNQTTVTATLTATSSAGAITQMQFSKNGGANWFALEPFVATRTGITLTAGQGINTILVRFRDAAGNLSAPVSDSILLDQTKPVAGPLTVISANPTGLTTGTLGLSATDNVGGSGVTQMQFSTNNGATFFAAEPFAATRTVNLPIIGVNTFTVRFIDAAGNISGNQNTSITRQ